MTLTRCSRRSISAGMSNSGSPASATSACFARASRAGNLARGEHAGGVAVDEHLDHDGGVGGLVARSADLVADEEGAQVGRVDRVNDVVG